MDNDFIEITPHELAGKAASIVLAIVSAALIFGFILYAWEALVVLVP